MVACLEQSSMNKTPLRSEIFSNVDAAWLHMESPTNSAMINGVLMFAEPIDMPRLRETIITRLLKYDRFRMRIQEADGRFGLPRWVEDTEFDLDFHLRSIRLPDPGDQVELQRLVGELMSTQLDFTKPLWQFHYVENYGNGSAIIARLHHCIADGLALVQVLLSLTDELPEPPAPSPMEEEAEPEMSPFARLIYPAVAAFVKADRAWQKSREAVYEGFDFLTSPTRVLDAGRLAASSLRSLAWLLLLPPDRKTIFKGKCDIEKVAAWSGTLQLEDVKAVGQILGCTINDVLLASVTGALRRYLERQGEPVIGLNIRAVVPVNLRAPDELDSLGNRFGLVFLSLPIGIVDPVRRLRVLKQRMDDLKNSPQAVVAFGILNAMGMTPQQIEKIIIQIFGLKGTAVMTNVPGPRQKLYLAGAALDDLIFWVPSPANLAMGVSIISYNGRVTLGVATDASLIPDPEAILKDFHDEFAFLRRWGRPPEQIRALDKKDAEQSGLKIQPGRCQAITKSGKPCKNPALDGLTTCRVHTPP